jgi:hypothetical protein
MGVTSFVLSSEARDNAHNLRLEVARIATGEDNALPAGMAFLTVQIPVWVEVVREPLPVYNEALVIAAESQEQIRRLARHLGAR